MRRLVLIVALVTGCSGVTASPSLRLVLTPAEAGQAYEGAATAANDAMDAASKHLSRTPDQVQAYCHARVDIERAFIASLDVIAFDPELDLLVATLHDADLRLIGEFQACLDAEGPDILKSIERPSLIEASRATRRAAMVLRTRLGLPTADGDFH